MDFSRTHYRGHGYFSDPACWAFTIIGIILILVVFITWIKIFKKAGEKGWKAIIPFYNFYIFCKLVTKKRYFWLATPIILLDEAFNELYMWVDIVPRPICMLVCFITTIFFIYFAVRICNHFAKSFGKSTGFGVFLAFVPIISYPIIAFGKSKYLGNAWLKVKEAKNK